MGEMADWLNEQNDWQGLDDFDYSQEEYSWTTKDGEVIPIEKLTDEHIKNIIRYFGKREPPSSVAFEAVCEEAESRGFDVVGLLENDK